MSGSTSPAEAGATQLRSLEERERARAAQQEAQAAQQRAVRPVEEGKRQRAGRLPKGPMSTARSCPFCPAPATVTDWRPISEWIVVEDCACQRFFLWAPLIERVR